MIGWSAARPPGFPGKRAEPILARRIEATGGAMSAGDPYDDLIMDHIRNARNYRVPGGATGKGNGLNPLCGDEMTVYVRIEGGMIRDAGFQCSCCGVSMASASIMTECVIGLSPAAARTLLAGVIAAVNAGAAGAGARPEVLAILDTVHRHPARARCAVLPWATLEASMENRLQTVIPH
jgi:nitrogen fixation NifU-like protein